MQIWGSCSGSDDLPSTEHLLDKLISVKVMVGGIDVASGELCPNLVQST